MIVNKDDREGARLRGLTFGCQWSSRRPPGFSVTIADAMVVAIGKLRESTTLTEPPPPAAIFGSIWLARKIVESGPSSLPYGDSMSSVLTVPLLMFGVGLGTASNTDSSTPTILSSAFG